jgi:hypothetical protein
MTGKDLEEIEKRAKEEIQKYYIGKKYLTDTIME